MNQINDAVATSYWIKVKVMPLVSAVMTFGTVFEGMKVMITDLISLCPLIAPAAINEWVVALNP